MHVFEFLRLLLSKHACTYILCLHSAFISVICMIACQQNYSSLGAYSHPINYRTIVGHVHALSYIIFSSINAAGSSATNKLIREDIAISMFYYIYYHFRITTHIKKCTMAELLIVSSGKTV